MMRIHADPDPQHCLHPLPPYICLAAFGHCCSSCLLHCSAGPAEAGRRCPEPTAASGGPCGSGGGGHGGPASHRPLGRLSSAKEVLLLLIRLRLRWELENRKLMVSDEQCCGYGSGIRNPVPFWPLDSGNGMGKQSGSGSGIRIRNLRLKSYFRELKHFFWG